MFGTAEERRDRVTKTFKQGGSSPQAICVKGGRDTGQRNKFRTGSLFLNLTAAERRERHEKGFRV